MKWILLILIGSAWGQYPSPDYPEGPDDYIEVQKPTPFGPDEPFLPYIEVENQEEERCDKLVEIDKPVHITTVCWVKTERVDDDDGQTLYIYLPPGCAAIATHQTKFQVDVFQDKECWLMIWDKTKTANQELMEGI